MDLMRADGGSRAVLLPLSPAPGSRPAERTQGSERGSSMQEGDIMKIVGQVQEIFKDEMDSRQLDRLKSSLVYVMKQPGSGEESVITKSRTGLC